MKEKIKVSLNVRDRLKTAQEIFKRMGRFDLLSQTGQFYYFEFEKDSDSLKVLLEGLNNHFKETENIGYWSQRLERTYTDNELRRFSLLRLSVADAPKANGGPLYGTKYDLTDACRNCGTGARQTSNLFLKPNAIPAKADIFTTLDDEIIVSLELKNMLVSEQVTGCEFRPVCNSKDKEKELNIFQMIINNEMPKLKDSSLVSVDKQMQCPECKRDGYFGYFNPSLNAPTELHYDKKNINTIEDFNCTYERFGRSILRKEFEDSHFAQPLVLVTPKIFNIFKKEKIKRVYFGPVFLFD